MSDKSSDGEEGWAIVDKDGELEVSDDGSSSSCSLEVVSLDTELVTFNRRSSERSVSPVLPVQEALPKDEPTAEAALETGKRDLEESQDHSDESDKPEDGLTEAEAEAILAQISHVSSMGPDIEALLQPSSDCSVSSISLLQDEEESLSHQELFPLSSSSASQMTSSEELPKEDDELGAVGGSSVKSGQTTDVSDTNSDTDSDFIRLEVNESLDVADPPSVMTASSVSSRFSFISQENSPLQSDNANIAADAEPVFDEQPVAHEEINNNVVQQDENRQVDVDQEDREVAAAAELEEVQDGSTESEIDDEENARIESDQSDTGSIPPLDDDMSFVNDIGDLPLVAGNVARQYIHNPNRNLNLKLDVIAVLMFTIVVGLGIGHYIATYDEFEAYDSVHNSVKNLLASCESQRMEHRMSLTDLKKERDIIKQRYIDSLWRLERTRLQNMIMRKQLNAMNSVQVDTDEKETLRLNLKQQINQLETENQELKQVIGRLKYKIHPANDMSSGVPTAVTKKESCDRSVVRNQDGKVAQLSECSTEDLESLHDVASLDNLFLKQEIGRLRYTKHPGNQITHEKNTESVGPIVGSLKEKTELPCVKAEELQTMKNQLNMKNQEIQHWQEKYQQMQLEKVINATTCIRYLLFNLTMTEITEQLDSTMLDKFLNMSISLVEEMKGSASVVTSTLLDHVSRATEEVLESVTEAKKIFDTMPESENETSTNFTDPESLNKTDGGEEKKAPHVKWSQNIKDVLNKTKNQMSNVSKQIKDTWLQVKNLSVKFWTQHEPAVSKTITKITNEVAKFGEKIKNKIERKVSKWCGKDKNKHGRHNHPSKKGGHARMKHQKIHKHPNEKNYRDHHHRKNNKHQNKQERHFQKMKNKSFKKFMKIQEKISRISEKRFYKMNNDAKSSLLEYLKQTRQFVVTLEPHLMSWLDCQIIFWKNQIRNGESGGREVFNCHGDLQDWQLNSLKDMVVQKDDEYHHNDDADDDVTEIEEDLETDDHNSDDEDHDDDDENKEDAREVYHQGIPEPHPDWIFKRADHRENIRQKERQPDWIFDRAHDREDIRQQESEPDWIFDRAKHREDLRQQEKQNDWMFDHEKDGRGKGKFRQRHPAAFRPSSRGDYISDVDVDFEFDFY